MGEAPGKQLKTFTDSEDAAEDVVPDRSLEFDDIVARYESALLRYAAHLIGSEYDAAQDVVQEVFIRLYREFEKQGRENIRNIKCWLFRVTHNTAMDIGRKRQRSNRTREELGDDPVFSPAIGNETDGNPVAHDDRQEAQALAMRELNELPEEQRNVVLLKMIQGMTLREISETTDLKIGTVNYRLTQGLRTLASRLKAYGLTE